MSNLEKKLSIAEQEFVDYDFDGYVVVGTSGWEYDTTGDEFTRKIYIENTPSSPQDDEDDDSLLAYFTVHLDGETPTDVYATLNGYELGSRASKDSEPTPMKP